MRTNEETIKDLQKMITVDLEQMKGNIRNGHKFSAVQDFGSDDPGIKSAQECVGESVKVNVTPRSRNGYGA